VRKAIGDVQQFRKDNDAALASYAEALRLFQQVGDKLGEANVRKAIGDVQQFRKDNDAALASYAEALRLFQQVGDKLGEANVRAAQGRLKIAAGQVAEAEEDLAGVIAIRRNIGDLYSEGADFGNFAIALLQNGHPAKALEYARKAKIAFEKIREDVIIAQVNNLIAACEAALE
jgi:tetratricopeptide (TPR) repeat protein